MLILIFSLMIVSDDGPYVVILKDAKRMEVKQAPVFEKGRAILELMTGEKVAIPASMINREATEQVNQAMEAVKVEEAKLAKLMEMEREAASEAAKEARKPVILKNTDFPDYEKEKAQIAETEARSTDAAPVVESAAAVPGKPYSKTFRSKDPVFVSAERRVPRENGGYWVECDIKVNHVRGAENVVLSYKANFVSAAAENHEIEVTPQTLDYNQTITVRFALTTNDELFRSEHGIRAEIKE